MATAEQLESLKRKIDALSPAARLLVASQLVGKGDYTSIDLGITIAQNVVNEWHAAQLLARQPDGRHREP
jgi:hypothetical protein